MPTAKIRRTDPFLLPMVLYYLDGPAAYIKAGPSTVVVGNSFRRLVVPRSRAPKIDFPNR